MLEEDFDERLEALTKKAEELSAEVVSLKKERAEEVALIPGAEYDFVPSVEEEIVFQGVARIVRVEKMSHELGLSAKEWELLAEDGGEHG